MEGYIATFDSSVMGDDDGACNLVGASSDNGSTAHPAKQCQLTDNLPPQPQCKYL